MPHVSRHTPTKSISDKTLNLFIDCVTAKWSPSERKEFFNDLLTSTERIMFSKRLGVIYMLVKGYTFEHIQETLRVSPSTVSRVWKGIAKGEYKHIVARIEHQADQKGGVFHWMSSLVPPIHQTRKQFAERMKNIKI